MGSGDEGLRFRFPFPASVLHSKTVADRQPQRRLLSLCRGTRHSHEEERRQDASEL